MIQIYCPNCGAGLKAKDDSRGKSFRCPKCREPVHVPDPSPELVELAESLEPEPQLAPPPASVQQNVNVTVGSVVGSAAGAGYPCRRCNRTNLSAVNKTTTAGYICFVIGLFASPFTCGLGILLCIIALFLNQKETRCDDCNAKWFDPASPIPPRANYVKLGVMLGIMLIPILILISLNLAINEALQDSETIQRGIETLQDNSDS